MKLTKANIEIKTDSAMKTQKKREAMAQINAAIKALRSGILLF